VSWAGFICQPYGPPVVLAVVSSCLVVYIIPYYLPSSFHALFTFTTKKSNQEHQPNVVLQQSCIHNMVLLCSQFNLLNYYRLNCSVLISVALIMILTSRILAKTGKTGKVQQSRRSAPQTVMSAVRNVP
jgi:hypothetical protein